MPRSSATRWTTTVAVTTLMVTACAPPPADPPPVLDAGKCSKDVLGTLYPGILTVGADQPVYPPWYLGDDPANGEGFEGAIAYALAGELHYRPEDVRWIRVPFAAALAPGAKPFDVNLSQFSITDQRRAAVDFSAPYFDVTQAVVTVRRSPAAEARSIADLRGVRLGAQVGSTSQTQAAALDGARPVQAYNTTADAKMALLDGAIDAVVADLPTAFTLANELRDGLIVGQLPATGDATEQFGVVLDHDSPLTRCVSWAVETLRSDGTLDRLERRWLADAGRAPLLN